MTELTPTRERETYTPDEVQQILGISRALTYTLLNAGTIPSRRAGRRFLISRKAFHAWMDSTDAGATR